MSSAFVPDYIETEQELFEMPQKVGVRQQCLQSWRCINQNPRSASFTIKKHKLLLLTKILGRALKIYGNNYDRSMNRRSNCKRIRSSKKKLQSLTRRLRRRFGVSGLLTALKHILTGTKN
jgi:hypothetical protein